MKDRIIIEETKECRPHPALREGVNCIDTKYCKYEQVPESFADLLTLCKNLKEVDIDTDEDYMSISVPKADLIYFQDGILMIAGFKRLEIKPAQMWQIIKNLIGEE